MSFGMIIQNQNMMKKQSCVIWIQTDTDIVYVKTDNILKDIAEILKHDLKLQIMNYNRIPLSGNYLMEKIKK